MEGPFIYDKYVTGKNFIGRKNDCSILSNILLSGKHVAIYDAPKTGKASLIQQTLFNMRLDRDRKQFSIGELSLLNVRDTKSFLKKFGETVIRTEASTPKEYSDIISTYLHDTHFIFNTPNYSKFDEILTLDGDIDENDIKAILNLPVALASAVGQPLYLIINEFQNITFTEDADRLLKAMENVIEENKNNKNPGCSLIICGSMLNAMSEIFEIKKYFYRQVEHLSLSQTDEKEIIEYIIKGFLSSGKVIEKESLIDICKLFRNNLWYVNHFAAICNSLSKGYITEATITEALDNLISIHSPRFAAYMNSLTTFQVNLLQAILDGHKKFSTSEAISKYGLNSSANVKRLKDALIKKEIVSFRESENPIIIDPLFEFWVKKYFFEME